MLCLKSILPKTKTATYKRKEYYLPIQWKDPIFVQEENSKDFTKGYRVPCRGDSGSGQIVSISIEPKPLQSFKYVLAAVFTSTIQDLVVENGKDVPVVPCGSTVFSYDSTAKKVVTLESQGHAQSTSWPEILDWIKNKAKIQ